MENCTVTELRRKDDRMETKCPFCSKFSYGNRCLHCGMNKDAAFYPGKEYAVKEVVKHSHKKKDK
jgi:glutaredoxin